jgi:hypothetical protein
MALDAAGLLGFAANLGLGLAGGYGSKPKVAMWKPVSPQTSQSQSLLGNLSNFGDITKLGQQYTDYMTQQQNALLPGYSANLAKGESDTGQLLGDASSMLSGDLPPDVIAQIQRSDAFGAMSGGYAGSEMSHNLTARDLGLNSLQMMQQGASMLGQGGNSAQQWASLAGQDIMNPASQFVTPQQQQAADLQNQLLKLQTLQNKFNVAAAPDPMLSGAMNAAGTLFGSSGGGGGGGGSSLVGSQAAGFPGGSSGGGGLDIMSLLGMFI